VIQVLKRSPLGVIRKDEAFDHALTFVSSDSVQTIDESYDLYTGKRLHERNHAKELSLNFASKNQIPFRVTFRAYNDGIAFRYHFPQHGHADSAFVVLDETTGFHLPQEGKTWMQPYDTISKWTPGYEKYYTDGNAIGDASPNPSGWCFPALFQVNGAWILLTESNVNAQYHASHLQNGKEPGEYVIHRPEDAEAYGQGTAYASAKTPWTLPWRVIITGASINTVVESNLVHHVADPTVAGDFSWVKPGRASWSWWSDQQSPQNFSALKKYIDFSQAMGWEYALVDANWNRMKDGNLRELVQYGKSKNVDVWAWYNSGGPHNEVSEEPRNIMNDPARRKEEMKKLQDWGVKGIKVDFFQSDKQIMMEEYMGILKDAADHQIMVNFHGCTIPRGWARTWPNMVSMESVRGAETYLFAKDFPEQAPLHNVHLAFTRNVIGSMDYTPITFSNTRFPHQTTNAHELALGVVFETGILHPADNAASYQSQPEPVRNFLKDLPVTWDDVKLISGSPSTDIVIARRKGNNWYIGCINGEKAEKNIVLDLSFLKEGTYAVSLLKDGRQAKKIEQESIAIKSFPFTQSIRVLPFGGWVAHVKSTTH
jgi:hypothetical protein